MNLTDKVPLITGAGSGIGAATAERLAADLGIDIPAYAAEMFAAKSDVSAFADAELLRMDSKEYNVAGKEFRVSVLETTSPQMPAQG